MSTKNSLIKRYESTAKTYQAKGDREWAKAKNDGEGYHYQTAREAYNRASINQEKADALRKK